MRVYPSLDDALREALRLSRAMTYKAAMAGVDRGGGKAVILGDPARDKSRALLAAYARAVERLGGRFHTGCDMGIDLRDVAVMGRHTRHISHTPPEAKLDTAGLAALGVFESIRAAARALGKPLDGLHVAVQGLGQVGTAWPGCSRPNGARLTVADVDPARAERAVDELRAAAMAPEAIYDVPVPTSSRRTPPARSSTTRRSRACAAAPWWARPTNSSPRTATEPRCTTGGSSTLPTTW